jgi:crotonobetaine/carnitine-CoA ligase
MNGVWHKGSSGSEGTVLEWLDARLESDPDGPFLDLCGDPYTAAQIDAAANRVATGLAGLGVAPGHTVATLLDNGAEAAIAWFAILKLGAISVPVNTALKGAMLRHVLDDADACVLIVQSDLADRPAALAHSLTALEHLVLVGPEDSVTGTGTTSGKQRYAIHSWAELMSAADNRPSALVRPEGLATIVYTGSTTGPSKGCALSHNYHLSITRQSMTGWGRRPDDVVWSPLPLFHFNAISSLLVGTLYTGGHAALARRFSVSGFWPEMNRTGATIASLLGSLAVFIARAEDHAEARQGDSLAANETLRLLIAAPMPPEIDELLARRFGIRTFSYGYGTTEASLVSWLPPGVASRRGSAGVVNTEAFDARIFDDSDHEVPVGEPGEIVVRPKQPHIMFEGYWQRPEATLESFRNLWFHTGDLGRIDEDGYLYFVDRKADYMRRRGENISSWEVEKVFHEHPDVVDVAVHAVPSDASEDDVKVTLVRRVGSDLQPETLCRWVIAQLPYYAVPRYFEFRDDLPRSATGRITKRELTEEGVTPATWDREAAGVTFERR